MSAFECFKRDFYKEIKHIPTHKRERIITPAKLRRYNSMFRTQFDWDALTKCETEPSFLNLD